jgi:septum formation protein
MVGMLFEKHTLLNSNMETIILASQSPRRKQLLEWAEVPFEIIIKSTDETFPANLPVEEIPIHIARQKALEVKKHIHASPEFSGKTILAADTIVVLDSLIIGKPVDRNDAVNILSSLSGKTHRVITGVVIMHETSETAFSDITSVEFHQLTSQQIEFYVDKYKPYDKAGAYAIQEWIGVIGIKSVSGDFYNVMGLPVSRVVQELVKL